MSQRAAKKSSSKKGFTEFHKELKRCKEKRSLKLVDDGSRHFR
jgi:hypothetical protein